MWKLIIEKGRLSQWLVCGGGVVICLTLGIMEIISASEIVTIFMAILAAAFGLNAIKEQ